MITLYINGIKIEAEEDMTIYQAAQKAGIYIPVLCYHPDLSTFGACRVCMVEANGRVVTACRAPVEEGMIVQTDTEDVEMIRKFNMELILANHNQDCQTCSRNNDCQLQEVSAFVGVEPDGMQKIRRNQMDVPIDDSNPFFHRDHSKCILCGICIRACAEINGVTALDFAFRGYNTMVSVSGNKPLRDSSCESCGECMERCPTGALARSGQQKPEREVKSVCPYCGVGCNIKLGTRGRKVVQVRGDHDNPVNEGELCVKGRFGFEFINHPERLSKPLVKKNGKLEEASWDEALDKVSQKLKEICDQNGADSIGTLSSARCSNEENYLFQKLFRSLGTNNIDHCARL